MDTHDYTRRYWGHDYIYKPLDGEGHRAKLLGWGYNIKKGDFLLLENGEHTTRYRVTTIEYRRDPSDMWSAEVVFAPRQTFTTQTTRP